MPLPTLRLPPHGDSRTARGETWYGYSFVPEDFHLLPSASSPGTPEPDMLALEHPAAPAPASLAGRCPGACPPPSRCPAGWVSLSSLPPCAAIRNRSGDTLPRPCVPACLPPPVLNEGCAASLQRVPHGVQRLNFSCCAFTALIAVFLPNNSQFGYAGLPVRISHWRRGDARQDITPASGE